jgi:hypothetical protein
MQEQQTEYLTTVEAADYLKVSRQFLEGGRHRGDGSGPDYIKLNRAAAASRAIDEVAAHRKRS